LSVSIVADLETFTKDYQTLYETCSRLQCAVIVGGRGLTESVRQRIQYASFGDNLRHLHGFAQSLYRKE
jgi:hypothetical protein